MTNPIAIVLGVFIIGAIMVDGFLFESGSFIFLARKAAALIEWLAFWR